jgi:hypothetical protein
MKYILKSTMQRGIHNIEREIIFERNPRLVAHDSEGFEAGRSGEFEAVKNFINRRSTSIDMNERLHMIWFVNRD